MKWEGFGALAEKVFELFINPPEGSVTVWRVRGIFIQANTVSHPDIVSSDTFIYV